MGNQIDYSPYITGRQNLIDSVGTWINPETPERKKEEIKVQTTVPQVENQFGPDVYVLKSVPPLKEEDRHIVVKGIPLLSHYDYDKDVLGKNPHKIPDPNLVKLIGQHLPDHRRHR